MSDPIADTEPVRMLTTPFDITGLVSIDVEHQSEVQAVYLSIQQGGEKLPPLYHSMAAPYTAAPFLLKKSITEVTAQEQTVVLTLA